MALGKDYESVENSFEDVKPGDWLKRVFQGQTSDVKVTEVGEDTISCQWTIESSTVPRAQVLFVKFDKKTGYDLLGYPFGHLEK